MRHAPLAPVLGFRASTGSWYSSRIELLALEAAARRPEGIRLGSSLGGLGEGGRRMGDRDRERERERAGARVNG